MIFVYSKNVDHDYFFEIGSIICIDEDKTRSILHLRCVQSKYAWFYATPAEPFRKILNIYFGKNYYPKGISNLESDYYFSVSEKNALELINNVLSDAGFVFKKLNPSMQVLL